MIKRTWSFAPTVAGTPDPIARFENRIHEWEGVWKSIDLRSVCFRQHGGWRNTLASIRLLAGGPEEYGAMDMTYHDDRFAVLQEISDIGSFDDFIDDLRANQLRIGDQTIRLDCPVPPVQPGGQLSPYGYTFEPQPRRWARTMNYVATDYLTFVLQGRGRQVGEFVTTEDHEHASRALFAHERPYEGFPDVMRSLFSVTYNLELPGMAAMLTVLAPSYAKIESSEQIDGKHLSVRVQGPPRSDASAFRVNSIMRGLDGSAERLSLEFTEEHRVDSPGYARFDRNVELASTPLVDLFLIYRGEHVDELRLVLPIRDTPNPRLLAHLAFDDQGAKLREYLFPETPKASGGFEMAVAWLFHFCGFEVVSYGVPPAKLDEEIDLLAFMPFAKAVMSLECKASELKTDKLVLLANRRDKLKAALPDHDIMAAAVTALDHATEPERREARGLDISILTRNEMEEILTMAERHASAQEVMEYVRRKVPSSL